MNKVFLSCSASTTLIEKETLTKLTRKERWQLKAHVSMCKACKAYQQQRILIDKAISQWYVNTRGLTKKILSEELKKTIINEIQKN